MRRFFFGALLFVVTACSGTRTEAQGGGSQSAGQDPVVAEVGDRKVTLKQLDDKWASLDPAERARITQLLYQNRRNVLELVMGDLLIEDAAKAAGMPSAQYLEQEMKKRQQAVSESDVKSFYEANKDRAQGRSFDELRGQISEFLASQREQQARAALVDELKKKRAKDVRVLLDPPREKVDILAEDPSLGPATAPVTIVEFSDYQ